MAVLISVHADKSLGALLVYREEFEGKSGHENRCSNSLM